MKHLQLNVLGKRGRKALEIHLFGICSHGFNKKLMAIFVGKADNLVLYTRAISGTDALDASRIKGRKVDVVADYFVGFFVGVCDVARQIGYLTKAMLDIRKMLGIPIALLHLEHRIINAIGVDSRRSACFEAADRKAEFPEVFCK
jgi:hypothetical protein